MFVLHAKEVFRVLCVTTSSRYKNKNSDFENMRFLYNSGEHESESLSRVASVVFNATFSILLIS